MRDAIKIRETDAAPHARDTDVAAVRAPNFSGRYLDVGSRVAVLLPGSVVARDPSLERMIAEVTAAKGAWGAVRITNELHRRGARARFTDVAKLLNHRMIWEEDVPTRNDSELSGRPRRRITQVIVALEIIAIAGLLCGILAGWAAL